MNIETTVENLNDSRVQEWELFLSEAFASAMPTVDIRKGSVVYDLIIRPNAILAQLMETNINRFRRASSLKEITENPYLVDMAMVDAILSNYGVERASGQKATGTVTIVTSTNQTTSVPAGATFTSGSYTFVTESSFIGVPDADMVTKETDKLMQDIGSGLYSFTVNVIAAEEGAEYQLSSGTQLTLASAPSNYVYSEATYDFEEGASAESNYDLLFKLADGISGKTLASRSHVRALLTEDYPGIVHGASIGMGQREMRRDRDNLFQQSYGGKADIYVQTASRPTSRTVRKAATLVDPVLGKWQLFLDRDEFAGVYKVLSIRPAGSTDYGGCSVTSDVRGLSLTTSATDQDEQVHDIQSYAQAAFSRFQTAALEFVDAQYDSSADTAFTTTREYDVELLGLPNIAAIQDNVLDDPWRSSLRYDDIVRAPIPCLLAISMTVRVPVGTSYSVSAVKSAIAERINTAAFSTTLSAATIADAAHSVLGDRASVLMPLDLFGELIHPSDGTSRIYRSGSTLRIPDDLDYSISTRTTRFFCDPADIDITVETV